MLADQLSFEVITERPVIRNDQISDINIAIDLYTSKPIGEQSTNYSINLCIVIDRSGSMGQDEKLEQAKKACVSIYENLNPSDKLTVLAFDDEVITVVNPQTPPNLIKERIMALQPGGQTNLSKGWYLGLLELQTYATEKHINRLILLSDGQVNDGEQKTSVLGAESSRARNEMGITTSTIGIGTDFQEDIMAVLANESGGRFWFIGEAKIEDIIKEEFSGALSVILERPRIEVSLPNGVTIIRELNNLQKTSDRYRIRPIKANDQFSFALQLRIDPTKIDSTDLSIGATLFDGTEVIQKTETNLKLGSVEEYAQSSEDTNVAIVVAKYFSAISDEDMTKEKDIGDITTRIIMLQSQSDLMKELESKLAGAVAISLEEYNEKKTEEEMRSAEERRLRQERDLADLRMEIKENESLICVDQLIDLMNGLGKQQLALNLMSHSSKHQHQRSNRQSHNDYRGESDDWAIRSMLKNASDITDNLINEFPDLKEELMNIREKINEQLANFS